MMDRNHSTYEEFVDAYDSYTLEAPERAILQRFGSAWPSVRMLDIGVGTGRTAYTFAAVAGEYVGVDYVQGMLDRCIQMCGESERARFQLCDARDLTVFDTEHFDFVLFSLNGLDSVSHEDRLRILREVRRVTKPDGHFFFSTRNIESFLLGDGRPSPGARLDLRAAYRWCRSVVHGARLRWHYSGTDVDALRTRDHAVLVTGDHDFRISAYHIRPQHQVEQLVATEWSVDTVYDPEGRIVDVTRPGLHPWLYFLCRPELTADG